MSSLLSNKARKWYNRVYNHMYHDDICKLVPELYTSQPVAWNERNWQQDETQKIRSNILLHVAELYWEKIDRKQVEPFELLESYLPTWIIFGLPRRPALVLFAVHQELKRQLFEDYDSYTDDYFENVKTYISFFKHRIYVYKLVGPIRQLLGLNTLGGFKKIQPRELPTFLSDTLLAYSTPSGVFQIIAQFVRGKSLQQGISFLRSLERFSSKLSDTTTVDDVVGLIEQLDQDRRRLEEITPEFHLPEPLDLSYLTDPSWIDDLETSVLGKQVESISDDGSDKEKAEIEADSHLKADHELQIAQQRIRRQLENRNVSYGPYDEYRKQLEAYKLYPYWHPIDRVELKLKQSRNRSKDLHYELCYDNEHFIVASKTRVVSGSFPREWKSKAKYYRWFNDLQKARGWMKEKVEEKVNKGYSIELQEDDLMTP